MDESDHEPILRAGDTCREIATADRVACIVDAADYFLHSVVAEARGLREAATAGSEVLYRLSGEALAA